MTRSTPPARPSPSDRLIAGRCVSSTDDRWAGTEPLPPDRRPKRGGRWCDHRQVIDAIAFEYRAGIPWTGLSERSGSWKGVRNRLRKAPGSACSPPCAPGPTRKATSTGPSWWTSPSSLAGRKDPGTARCFGP
ncbi:transposase [Streptomyces roseolilacinus]|uniref:transposase n=1 Tax=Streptomyces roseolilacinus TaxID=66904 RepID=UPI0016766D99